MAIPAVIDNQEHRLGAVNRDALCGILERVPPERMSETCRQFTLELLLANQQRLLEQEPPNELIVCCLAACHTRPNRMDARGAAGVRWPALSLLLHTRSAGLGFTPRPPSAIVAGGVADRPVFLR